MKIYKSKYLESTFLEVINHSGKNIIAGCIYRHPCMELNEFNNDYLNSLTETLLREKNKHIILMEDFTVDRRYQYCPVSGSDVFSSLLPQITSPTRVCTE